MCYKYPGRGCLQRNWRYWLRGVLTEPHMRLNYHVEHFAEDIEPRCVGLSKGNRSGCSAVAMQPHSRAERLWTSPIPFPRDRQIVAIILGWHLQAPQPWGDSKNTAPQILPQAFELKKVDAARYWPSFHYGTCWASQQREYGKIKIFGKLQLRSPTWYAH